MRSETVRATRIVILACLLTGTFSHWFTAGDEAWAVSPKKGGMTEQADASRGHELFNGKGICNYCHGRDGIIGQRPSLAPETERVISQLRPPPPDLRNPQRLTLQHDEERFRAIREGHPGTGMFPDQTLSDQEISDILAYLATLRGKTPPASTPHP